jgi:hypothetical protein
MMASDEAVLIGLGLGLLGFIQRAHDTLQQIGPAIPNVADI